MNKNTHLTFLTYLFGVHLQTFGPVAAQVGDFGPLPIKIKRVVDDGRVIHDYRSAPREPETALDLNNTGVMWGSRGDWPQSIKYAEMAVAGDPNNFVFRANLSGAHLQYGVFLQHARKTLQAIDEFRAALFADPNNMPASNLLDKCLELTEAIDPKNVTQRLALAKKEEFLGHFKFAAAEYQVCAKMKDTAAINYELGRSLIKAGAVKRGCLVLMKGGDKAGSAKDKAKCLELLGKYVGSI